MPPIIEIRVVLPDPEWPTIDKNSPLLMVRDILSTPTKGVLSTV
jgi:hypothetical protein